MKAENARRAATLFDALNALPAVEAEAEIEKGKRGYARKVMNIEICHEEDSGGECVAEATLDLATGRLVLSVVREMIVTELRALGVELPEEGK